MTIHGDINALEEFGAPHEGATNVQGVVVVGYDPVINAWMGLRWNDSGSMWLVGGGQEQGESFEQNAIRELAEETGYTSYSEMIKLGGEIISHYYNEKKDSYRRSTSYAYLFILDSTQRGEQSLEPHEDFSVSWLEYDDLVAKISKTGGGVEHWLAVLTRAQKYVLEQTA
jgi:8-oxo-dGTP pyrophosphatase MutT (NUDIX family)